MVVVGAVVTGVLVSSMPLVTAGPLAAGVLLVVIALRAPRLVVVTTLAMLPFVGLLRRASGSYVSTLDPILFIPPMIAAVCLVASVRRGDGATASKLGVVVAAFLALGAAGALNPGQGGLKIGIIGAGLFVGPLIWFFVGQRLADLHTLWQLQRILSVIALIVVAYGLTQLIVGFTPFDQRWIDSKLPTYSALSIKGQIRPFSTFASAAEYSYFLVLGAVLFAARIRSRRWLVYLAPVLLFVVSAFFAGSRGIFLACCIAALLVVIGSRIKHLAVALLICVVCSVFGLSLLRFVPLASGDSVAASTRNRTLEGLTDPFNDEVSTANLHRDSFSQGVIDGLKNPIGQGAGVTNSASKFGGTARSGEHDVPNVIIAYGWAGALALLVLMVNVYRLTKRAVATGRPELIGPAVFVLALFGSWFTGGLYAVTALVWFLLGAIDQEVLRHEAMPVLDQGEVGSGSGPRT